MKAITTKEVKLIIKSLNIKIGKESSYYLDTLMSRNNGLYRSELKQKRTDKNGVIVKKERGMDIIYVDFNSLENKEEYSKKVKEYFISNKYNIDESGKYNFNIIF